MVAPFVPANRQTCESDIFTFVRRLLDIYIDLDLNSNNYDYQKCILSRYAERGLRSGGGRSHEVYLTDRIQYDP